MADLTKWERIATEWSAKLDAAQRQYGDNHPLISDMEAVSDAIISGDRDAYHAAMHVVFETHRGLKSGREGASA